MRAAYRAFHHVVFGNFRQRKKYAQKIITQKKVEKDMDNEGEREKSKNGQVQKL